MHTKNLLFLSFYKWYHLFGVLFIFYSATLFTNLYVIFTSSTSYHLYFQPSLLPGWRWILSTESNTFVIWYRSSHQRCSLRKGKGVLRNFAKFTGKHLCQSLFFNEVAGLSLPQPATLLKKRLWYRCFPVNFCEISKNTFFTEHLWTTPSVDTKKW